MKNRHQQIIREVCYALGITLFYIIGWIGFAYFSPDGRGLLGFPIWFELSCLYLPIIFVLLLMIIIKIVYKNIDLEDTE